MRRLRRAVCALLSLPLIVLSAAQARGESSLSVTQAFVQGETLYVYLPVEEGLTAELYGAEGSIPAANGVQAVGEAGTPVSYYLLVDDSQSMRSMKRKIESFASSLAQSSEAGTRFAVLTFGESLEVVQEKTQDADGALAALRGISYDGQMTDLPRGVLDALAYLESEPREEGELVEAVLISDGVTEEAADSPGLEAAQERASGASVVLHTLGLATARDVSAQGLSELSSLGKGVHAEIPTGVFVSCKQCRAYHYMVLRTVHMAEGQVHHPPNNGDRVTGGLTQAKAENAVHALSMTVIAHIVAVDAPGLAAFLFMADGALHHLVLRQVLQGRFTNQAFFHAPLSSSVQASAIRSVVSFRCSRRRRREWYISQDVSFAPFVLYQYTKFFLDFRTL